MYDACENSKQGRQQHTIELNVMAEEKIKNGLYGEEGCAIVKRGE